MLTGGLVAGEIDAAFVFARAHFVNVFNLSHEEIKLCRITNAISTGYNLREPFHARARVELWAYDGHRTRP